MVVVVVALEKAERSVTEAAMQLCNDDAYVALI